MVAPTPPASDDAAIVEDDLHSMIAALFQPFDHPNNTIDVVAYFVTRREAALHADIARLTAERDEGAGKHPCGLTWRESVDLINSVVADIASEIGCLPDNEEILIAIDALRTERDAAYAKGIDDAAKVADANAQRLFESRQFPTSPVESVERLRWTQACRQDTAVEIATTIRALLPPASSDSRSGGAS